MGGCALLGQVASAPPSHVVVSVRVVERDVGQRTRPDRPARRANDRPCRRHRARRARDRPRVAEGDGVRGRRTTDDGQTARRARIALATPRLIRDRVAALALARFSLALLRISGRWQSLINVEAGGTSRLSGIAMSLFLGVGIVSAAPLLGA